MFNMTEICSVTSCKTNTKEGCQDLICYAFPADEETCKSWILRSGRYDLLGKSCAELQITERLCQLHFDSDCFVNSEEGVLLKPGAKPTIFDNVLPHFSRAIGRKDLGSANTEDVATVRYKPLENNVSVIAFQVEIDKNQQQNNFNSVITSNGLHNLGKNQIYLEPGLIITKDEHSDAGVSSYLDSVINDPADIEPVNIIIGDIDNAQDWQLHENTGLNIQQFVVNADLLCRICAEESENLVYVFSQEGLTMELPQKISWHLPIKVNEEDKLPLKVCTFCITKLNCCHDLVNCCLEADAKLKKIFNLLEGKTDEFNGEEFIQQFDHNSTNESILPDIEDVVMEQVPSLCWSKTKDHIWILQDNHLNIERNNRVSTRIEHHKKEAEAVVNKSVVVSKPQEQDRCQISAEHSLPNYTTVQELKKVQDLKVCLSAIKKPTQRKSERQLEHMQIIQEAEQSKYIKEPLKFEAIQEPLEWQHIKKSIQGKLNHKPVKLQNIQESLKLQAIQEPLKLQAIQEPLKLQIIKDQLKQQTTQESMSKIIEEPLKLQAIQESVLSKTVQEPIQLQTVEEPLQRQTVQEPLQLQTVQEPLQLQTIQEPLKLKTVHEPLQLKTFQEPLKTIQEPMQLQKVQEPVQLQKVQEPVQLQNIQGSVQLQEVHEPTQLKTLKEPVEPKTIQEPVQPKTIQDPVQPKTIQDPVQPKTIQDPVQPKTIQDPIQLQTVQEPMQLKNINEPVNLQTTTESNTLQAKEDTIQQSDDAIIISNNHNMSNYSISSNIRKVVDICIESTDEKIPENEREKTVIRMQLTDESEIIDNIPVLKDIEKATPIIKEETSDVAHTTTKNTKLQCGRATNTKRGRVTREWVCEVCDCVALKKATLIRHQRMKHTSRNFQCDSCPKRFRDGMMLKKHKKKHSESKPEEFICAYCDSSFPSKKALQEHFISHHGSDKRYKCNKCHKSYNSSSSFDIHMSTHSNETPFLCDLCGKSFKHVSNLRSHKRSHLDDIDKNRQICKICGKGFRSRFHLSEHINVHENKRPYQCEVCGKHFHKKIQLRQHSSAHLGFQPYSCPLCGVKFNRRGNMTQHLKRHNQERKFVCKICDEQFETLGLTLSHRKKHSQEEVEASIIKQGTPESSLFKCNICGKILGKKETYTAHMRSHSGEKMFECTQCGKRLSNKGSLMYHVRAFHTADRPFACQFCGEGFLTKDGCLVHERIHTGDKPYKCSVCDMAFRCRSNLTQHSRVHSKHRPYGCEECGKSFQRKGALSVHKRTHTGERPYACDICERRFTQKNDMLKHKRTHLNNHTHVERTVLICERCGQSVADKRELAKHKLMHETFEDIDLSAESPLPDIKTSNSFIATSLHCTHCGQDVANKHELSKHQLLHMTFDDGKEQQIESSPKVMYAETSVIGKLYCSQCGENLADKHELAKHQLLHMTFEDIDDSAIESNSQTVLITTENLITDYSDLEVTPVMGNSHTLIMQRF